MVVITYGVYVLKTGNNIGKDGTKELCEGLMMNKTLLKLNISGMGRKVSFFCFKNHLNTGKQQEMPLEMKEQKQCVKHSKQIKHFWNYLYGVCESITQAIMKK